MKIAIVSPLYESVPPKLYGGTERVVSYLTEELVKQGHDVTLFASGDSQTEARLISPCSEALRLHEGIVDYHCYNLLLLELVQQRAEEFDIVHYNIDYMHFPLSRRCDVPQVTTLHGRLNIPDLVPLYEEFNEMPLISISNSQRKPLPFANWLGTVYHGLPSNLLQFNKNGGDYLAFLGRISPEKRVDRAIEIAIKSGYPLKIAAKVDKADKEYFETEIEPLLAHPLVEFLGEINEHQKNEFLGNAKALLFPIDWPEPFGLVMIEAMACGTPVIAFKHGSVPEVIDEGFTGFIVNSVEEAVEVLNEKIPNFNRQSCREIFEVRFTAQRMAKDYLRLFEKQIEIARSGKNLANAYKRRADRQKVINLSSEAKYGSSHGK